MPTPNETGAERVRHYLQRAGAQSDFRTHELPGDASTRTYVRITNQTGSSRMLLVHQAPFDPDVLPFLNVAKLLHHMGVRVPDVIRCEGDLGIVELQDLGDTTLQTFLDEATPGERTACYVEAVATIDRMQRRGRDLASTRYAPFGLAFDVEKLTWELEFFTDHFLISARGAPVSAEERAALRKEFLMLSTEIAAEPRVFCHRDYHSRNLMRCDGHLYVIDFQDARMGPDTYDLVSLLRDCYVDHPANFVDQMIDEYLHLASAADHADFRRRFDVMSVQRHLKALGTFGYQATVFESTRYRDDVPRTLNYVRQVFDAHARFDRLHALLAVHVPELE